MSPYALAGSVIIAFGAGWYVEGLRWDHDKLKTAEAANVALVKAGDVTEGIRSTFVEYKKGAQNEIDTLRRGIAGGTVGLRVHATCVPGAAAASGTSSGTAALTASAGQAYFELRQGIAEQYGLLKLCRAALIQRSTSPKN